MYNFALVADPQRSLSSPLHELTTAVQTINGMAPTFTIFLGDLVDEADGQEGSAQWARVSRVLELLDHPRHFVVGNHDASSIDTDYTRRWCEATGSTTRQLSFRVGPTRFYILDTTRFVNGRPSHLGRLGASQLDWLVSQIEASEDGTPVVIFSHNSLAPDESWGVEDNHIFIEAMANRKNIFCYSGHIHRSKFQTHRNIVFRSVPSLSFSLGQPRWLAWSWQEMDDDGFPSSYRIVPAY